MSDVAIRLLVQYTTALQRNPLRTKMYTSGTLAALAEILAGKFAGVGPAENKLPPGQVSEKEAIKQQPLRFLEAFFAQLGINKRALQMFIYGFAISAPLGHVMTGVLQRAFAGKTTARDRVMQIITANLTTAVISNTVYLICMAYINGARSIDRIIGIWRSSFMFLMRVTWLTSPISIGVAQKYLPPTLWEPYFALVRFVLSTAFNTITKKKQMALQRKKKDATNDQDLRKGAAQKK